MKTPRTMAKVAQKTALRGPMPFWMIVHIQLRHLRDRLAQRRLSLEVSEEAIALLARKGYDPTYGARPLKRVIQREISDPLALALLEGRYTDGAAVQVDVADGDLILK